jgi:lipopolysaccharide export system protein LptA
MIKFIQKTSVLVLCLIISTSAWSLSSDKDKPMEIEADRVDVDEQTGVSTFTGNVIIVRGSLRLTGSKVVVHEKDSGLTRVIATGNLARFKQRPDGKKEDVIAEAKQIDYDAKKNILTLINTATIHQGKDTFSGNKIVYDANKDIIVASKSPGGKQRVKITIQPKAEEKPANKKPAQKSWKKPATTKPAQ